MSRTPPPGEDPVGEDPGEHPDVPEIERLLSVHAREVVVRDRPEDERPVVPHVRGSARARPSRTLPTG